ncbi:agamous-like MADS-box protein AGL80 [Silene latifolia]|uniref:agamous-like MADS-box protein AGL80 n=1 Tax=Silene latifolia TaxID=37657 RepID=UPI003D7793F4
MGRQKVKLQYIENNTARKVTFKKRVAGLLKKAEELQILCGVIVCIIVYGPYDEAPFVWPANHAEAARILLEYKSKPEMEHAQRKFSQEAFLKRSVTKSKEKYLRLLSRNREMEMGNVMVDLLCGKPVQQVPYNDIADLIWVIEDKKRSMQPRVRFLEAAAGNAPAANLDAYQQA